MVVAMLNTSFQSVCVLFLGTSLYCTCLCHVSSLPSLPRSAVFSVS